jgi:cell division protein FtsA
LSGLEGARLWYSPLASAKAVLSREDAENGAVVVDIGEHLTHVGVFLRGALFHSGVIPIGGTHFTKDLEITKQLGGIKNAERIKRVYGTVLPEQVPLEEMIALEDEGRQVSRRELAEVLQARGGELMDLVLKEIVRSDIIDEIHGGVHLVGGGSLLSHLPILAQNVLRRPRVVLGKVLGIQGIPHIGVNPFYTNALGAVKILNEGMDEPTSKIHKANGFFEKLKNMFSSLF